jgi:hypothetical protein
VPDVFTVPEPDEFVTFNDVPESEGLATPYVVVTSPIPVDEPVAQLLFGLQTENVLSSK